MGLACLAMTNMLPRDIVAGATCSFCPWVSLRDSSLPFYCFCCAPVPSMAPYANLIFTFHLSLVLIPASPPPAWLHWSGTRERTP